MSESNGLSIWRSPIKTLYYFTWVVSETCIKYAHYFVTHPGVLFILVPLCIGYVVLSNIEGTHSYYVLEFRSTVLFIVKWLGLGILSSIGLGTGMHTGLLFLFPYIFTVCLEAKSGTPFFELFKKVFFPCLLWGTGTAIGEIPPYAISRAARLAGIENDEFDEIRERKSNWAFLDAMKLWMINFVQKHGFIGVLIMSAWPNAAFDLCGICCGHFLMPFWTFFLATFIGKALLKVNLQACFFITLFTEEYLTSLVSWIEHAIPNNMDLCVKFGNKYCHVLIKEALHSARGKFSTPEGLEVEEGGWLKMGWNGVILLFVGFFVVSCVEQFANLKKREVENRKKMNKSD